MITDYKIVSEEKDKFEKQSKELLEKGFDTLGELNIKTIPEYGVTGLMVRNKILYTREFIKAKELHLPDYIEELPDYLGKLS